MPEQREIILTGGPRTGHTFVQTANQDGTWNREITLPNPPGDREETEQEIRSLQPVAPGSPESHTYRFMAINDKIPDQEPHHGPLSYFG